MKNQKIVVLKGPDRVRKRPAVIFGSDGAEGAAYAVRLMLDMFVAEAAKGLCKKISVTIKKDNSLLLKCFDNGEFIDETVTDGKAAWEEDFCELYAAPREDEDNYIYSPVGDFNKKIDLCAVQYVSEFMRVETVCDGVRRFLNFEKGYNVGGLQKENTTDAPYTKIEFKPDKKVFSSAYASYRVIADTLSAAAITIAGLRCVVIDERTSEKETFYYQKALADYAKSQISSLNSTPLYIKEIEATGKERYNKPEYHAKAKIALAFSNTGYIAECIHNHGFLEHRGSHFEAVFEEIKRVVNWRVANEDIGVEDIMSKLVLIIETECPDAATCWQNAAKKAITNKMITDMCIDLLKDDFSYYIEKNKDAVTALIDITK